MSIWPNGMSLTSTLTILSSHGSNFPFSKTVGGKDDTSVQTSQGAPARLFEGWYLMWSVFNSSGPLAQRANEEWFSKINWTERPYSISAKSDGSITLLPWRTHFRLLQMCHFPEKMLPLKWCIWRKRCMWYWMPFSTTWGPSWKRFQLQYISVHASWWVVWAT